MLECDHIVPLKEGGTSDMPNLTTACNVCNLGKAAVPLGSVAPAVDELEVLASIQEMFERKRALHEEIQASAALRAVEEEALETFGDWWERDFGTLDGTSLASARRFLRLLGLEEMRDAINATMTFVARSHENDTWQIWKYFCGVCWTKIRRRDADGE